MSATGKTIRAGFLGTGYIADWHARALRSVRGVTLAAVCDKDVTRAQSFAARHGVERAHGSLEEMLGDRAIDAVHVLLPPDLHHQAALEVIRSGRHVLLEKPMAVSEEECAALLEQADRAGVRVGIGHNFLFCPAYERLKGDLVSGRLGKIDQVTITWNRPLDQLITGPFHSWMFREPGNIMLEVGSHSVAHMLDLLGTVELTSARATNGLDLPGHVRFYRRWQVDAKRGPTAITLFFSFVPGFSEHTIHVRGSLAAATADLERGTYLLHRHTRYGPDYDRYRMLVSEARDLRSMARRNFGHYVLSKLKLSDQGSLYGVSIARALQSIYSQLPGSPDPRMSPGLGREVVKTSVDISRLAEVGNCARRAVYEAPSSSPAIPKVLVLGATGFIGRELTRQLVTKEVAIRVLVRDPGRLPPEVEGPLTEVVVGDASCSDDLNRALEGITHVYHLVRANAKTWSEYYERDVLVTKRVAEACLAKGVRRLVYTGTIDSYYTGVKAGTITEETPLDPRIQGRNLYARAKAASEDFLMALHRERGLPVVIFRPGIVIGRGGSPYHWGVGMWSWGSVCQVWGEGSNELPLVLVEDVAAGLIAALDSEQIEGEVFNLVGVVGLSAREYLDEFQRYAGIELQIIQTPPWKFYVIALAKWLIKILVRHPDREMPTYRDWESRTQRAPWNCSKARARLGWEPTVERSEIIRKGIHVPVEEWLA
jgi:predicted dehydrogenase/nucleoside-diphosphate-sugar epimerase